MRRMASCILALSWTGVVTRAGTAQTPVEEPAPVTVSGVLFGEYRYALRSGPTGAANNFDITRAYLTVTGRFADGVGGRVTADVYRNGEGSLGYRLKYGYASWNPRSGPLTYKLGMVQTPFVEHNENLWDYRVQGSDPTDRAGYLSSADLGLAVDGTWSGETVTLSAGVYNGEFYSKAPGDSHKDVAGRLSVRLASSDDASRLGGLRVTGFALAGEPTGGGTRQRYLGQVSYRSKAFWVAAFLMSARDRWDTATVAQPTVTGRLLSAFGVVKASARVSLLGRFDWHDRNTAAGNDRLARIIAGTSYRVNASLRGLVNIDHTWYEGGSPTPALDQSRSQLLFQVQLNY